MINKSEQKKFWSHDQKKRRSPDHPVIEAFVNPKIDFVLKHLDVRPETKLLDVGCGNGYFTFYWAKLCDVTGVDFSKEMLNNNSHPKLILGNAENLPFDDDTFDIVFCSNLLHHLENIEKVLKEMRRVSKRYVIVSEPNRNNPLLLFFALLKKEERGILPLSKNFLIKQGKKVNLIHKASIVSGMIFPNKTRVSWLPLLGIFEKNFFMGAITEIIFEK